MHLYATIIVLEFKLRGTSNFKCLRPKRHTSPTPAVLLNASGPQRQRGLWPCGRSSIRQADKALQNTTRTARERTGWEEGDSVGPGRSQEPVLTAGWEKPRTGSRISHHPPDGDRSPSDHTDGIGTKEPSHHGIGTRKRLRDGETRSPFERMVATRQWFATHSGRVAREKDLVLAEFLG